MIELALLRCKDTRGLTYPSRLNFGLNLEQAFIMISKFILF